MVIRRIQALSVVVVLSACAAPIASTAPADTPADAPTSSGASGSVSAGASAAPGAPVEFVAEVGGLRIAGRCTGSRDEGQPAIVLMHGLGDRGSYFSTLEEELADRTMVCAYDRPGGSGESDPRTTLTTVEEVAHEARALLAAIDVEPPYFVIGHSAGGALANVFAHLYRDEVAGFVSMNAMPPYTAWAEVNASVAPPGGAGLITEDLFIGDNPERVDFRGNDVMAHRLPDEMPFALMFGEDPTCGGRLAYCQQVFPRWMAIQQSLANAGVGGRFVRVRSGHDMLMDAIDDVRTTIDEVWAEATP